MWSVSIFCQSPSHHFLYHFISQSHTSGFPEHIDIFLVFCIKLNLAWFVTKCVFKSRNSGSQVGVVIFKPLNFLLRISPPTDFLFTVQYRSQINWKQLKKKLPLQVSYKLLPQLWPSNKEWYNEGNLQAFHIFGDFLTMNIDVLDRVENRFNKLIRKSSELVVVQFQPFKAESINQICFRFFSFLESYLVRSSNVGVGIWEIRLLSSQRFWRWSPNSSKSPSANLIQHFKGINDTKKSLTRRHCCHSDGGFWAGGVVEGRLLGTGWFYLIAETATAVAL